MAPKYNFFLVEFLIVKTSEGLGAPMFICMIFPFLTNAPFARGCSSMCERQHESNYSIPTVVRVHFAESSADILPRQTIVSGWPFSCYTRSC